MMVEVFCGILAGAQYSNKIRTWKVTDRIANLVRTASHSDSAPSKANEDSLFKDTWVFFIDAQSQFVHFNFFAWHRKSPIMI